VNERFSTKFHNDCRFFVQFPDKAIHLSVWTSSPVARFVVTVAATRNILALSRKQRLLWLAQNLIGHSGNSADVPAGGGSGSGVSGRPAAFRRFNGGTSSARHGPAKPICGAGGEGRVSPGPTPRYVTLRTGAACFYWFGAGDSLAPALCAASRVRSPCTVHLRPLTELDMQAAASRTPRLVFDCYSSAVRITAAQ